MIYLVSGRVGSGKTTFADLLVRKGLPETTLFNGDIADMTAKFCQVSPADTMDIVRKHPNTAFKLINIDACDMDRRLNFVKPESDKIKAEIQFDKLDKAERKEYDDFEEKLRIIAEDDDIDWMPENLVGIYNYVNDGKSDLDSYADEIVKLNKLHNRVVSIIEYLADNGVITRYESDSKCVKVVNEKGYAPIDCFADVLLGNDKRFAEFMRVYMTVANSIGDVDNVTYNYVNAADIDPAEPAETTT